MPLSAKRLIAALLVLALVLISTVCAGMTPPPKNTAAPTNTPASSPAASATSPTAVPTAAPASTDGGASLEAIRQAAINAGFEVRDDYSDFGGTTPVDGFRLVYEDEHVYDFVDILEFESEDQAQGYPLGGVFAGDHEYIIVDRFVAELRAGDEDFPNDLEKAAVKKLFAIAAGGLDVGTTEPPAGGVEKLPAEELTKHNDEITALFQAPPEGGDEVTYALLARMMPPELSIVFGNTKYEKVLNADYALQNGEWQPGRIRYIYETWRKDDRFMRTECLYVFDYFHPEWEGDTECELYRLQGPDYYRYGWMKSETMGLLDICIGMDGRLQNFDRYSITNIPGAKYYIYPGQEFTVNGHPCQVFGMEYEGWCVYIWYAIDLGHVLISEFVNGDMLLFTYYYANTYVDRDDSFFGIPENVDFPLVLGE